MVEILEAQVTDAEKQCCAKCQGDVELDDVQDLGCYPCTQTERVVKLLEIKK